MKNLINYAIDNFKDAQKFNSKTSLKIGGLMKFFLLDPWTLFRFLQKESSCLRTVSRSGLLTLEALFSIKNSRIS